MVLINSLNSVVYGQKMDAPACRSKLFNRFSYGTR